MGKYEEIRRAREVLGLGEAATLPEIKNRFRTLLKEWHPDVSGEDQEVRREKTIAIIQAYRVIMDYCAHYRFSFSREEVERYLSPEEMWAKHFGRDPIWGNYGDDESDRDV